MSGEKGCTQRELFLWKREHDICLVREVLVIEPYIHKPSSKERGNAWTLIGENLNKIQNPIFKVTKRAVRDRFSKLLEKFKKTEREEARASGIEGTEVDEICQGLADITERMEEAASAWKDSNAKEKEKENHNKERAIDMRKKATESLSETRKRKEMEENEVTPRRKRRSAEVIKLLEDSVKFKKDQAEKEITLRQEELQERQLSRQSNALLMGQQLDFMKTLQEQQQQFMLQMQQQNMQLLRQITELMENKKN